MAQLSGTQVFINGQAIKQFAQLSIEESIFQHAYIRLVLRSETIDNKGQLFNESKNLIGSPISVKATAQNELNGVLEYEGLVTGVEATRFSGHMGDIIITGTSPTILLDSMPHCKSFEKKALKNIFQDVLSHFPANMLKPSNKPIYPETLSYTVQYEETAWYFISRLCARYGEFFYYNGKETIIGRPQGKKANLIFGTNLNSFNVSMKVKPAGFKQMAYDFINNQVYDASPNSIPEKAGLNELGKFVYNKSKQFYGGEPAGWNNQFLTNKKQLEDTVNTRAAVISSRMVSFEGKSTSAAVQLGGTVTIKGNNILSNTEESYGEYTVTSVLHSLDGQGNYQNVFDAVPSSVKVAPAGAYSEPHCETQTAVVTDNNDPKGLGRVRVKFHWMKGSQKTPWIRIASPHGGGGKGMFFIPEVGEEAIVGFEGGSAHKPFVIGTAYHGKAKTSFGNAGNDVKALQTRSGNKLIMNDNEGSVFLTDKGGADMKFDGAGNVVKNTNKNHADNTGELHTIDVGGGASVVKMDKDGNITFTANTNLKITVGSSSFEMRNDGTIIAGGKIIAIGGSEAVAIASPQGAIDISAQNNHIGGITKIDNGDCFIN
jgi:uncharacterized protein involved in type VI secretion and phage assembly